MAEIDGIDIRQQRFANIIRWFLQITAEKIDAFFECRRNGINEPWMPGEASGGITCKAQLCDDAFVLTVKASKEQGERKKHPSLIETINELQAIPAKWKELNDPVSEIMKIRYGNDWACCVTCGQPTGSADVWQDTCPRCAELAALEREIGRAYLEWREAHDSIEWLEPPRAAVDIEWTAYRAAQGREIKLEEQLDKLITRYRALLAAGAEAATGGEES